jgi:hypothetical protein
MLQHSKSSALIRQFVLILAFFACLFLGFVLLVPTVNADTGIEIDAQVRQLVEDAHKHTEGIRAIVKETQILADEFRQMPHPIENEDTKIEAGKKLTVTGKELGELAYKLESAGEELINAVHKTATLPELPPIVQDLGLILIVAAIMLLLFKWLNQPVVLGYLLAGFFVSPYFLPTQPDDVFPKEYVPELKGSYEKLKELYEWLYQYIPDFIPQIINVHDHHSIHVWAEIGIIFMLFGLGLEFSFKKLLSVGRIAGITGGFEVVSTTIIGYFI